MSDGKRARLRKRQAGLIESVGTPDEALQVLKADGANPIDAIAAIRSRYALTLQECKEALDAHPDWEEDVRVADYLRDRAEAAVEGMGQAPGDDDPSD